MKVQTIDEKIDECKNICIVGGGGIGRAAGLILKEWGNFVDTIYIGDAIPATAKSAVDWIEKGSYENRNVEAFSMPLEGTNDEFNKVLKKSHIVLDCLPGCEAPRIAKLAKNNRLEGYVNLTEYVKETNEIMDMSRDSETAFLLQTGLAPGAINVVANGLYNKFCEDFGVEKADRLSMKVGALTKNAVEPHYYGFTWSEIGVATEYLEPATVIRDFVKAERPSLTERSNLVIDGVTYEEALTSGGTADLPDALQGKVRNLDYKTLRYPGHYEWIDELLKEIPEGNERVEKLQAKMQERVPRCESDVVILYASAQGHDKDNNLRVLEKSYRIEPFEINNTKLRAIQISTAIPLVESAGMVASENYKGLITQSMIPPARFMNGRFVSKVYK